ncbi:rhomboid family intramembrane serine protease [Luteipulveratus sp. YIM 133132]|uniref:rhomboid family intramembrane serine protease n=1 Tax=Luteipulveratus flavus TaxID=3031728 RepID=UPI0023B0C501|nr:rhomboid family intramembrane serine protease [Luteipulveratus sp. YIM 133132]MDE9364412.1 rhomboid family intramembrane serine protease [Luteipulveratus sp. YIM 133132]
MSSPTGPTAEPPAEAPPTCPRHPDQVAYVRCQRCNRPTCPACQRPASVGIQCVDCVKEQQRASPVTRSIFGGRAVSGRPVVTIALIAICVVVYVGQLSTDRVTADLQFAPVLGRDEPWRFLTAAFLHDPNSILHILFNMYALWICGQYLEPMLGRARFLALYLVSAVGGSVGYALLASTPATAEQWQDSGWFTPTVGASGAVFGLFAAVVVLNRHLGREIGPMLTMIAINAAIPFFVSNIAWQAHLGGAVTGAAVAAVIAVLGRDRRQLHWGALAGVLLVLAVLAVIRYQTVTLPPGLIVG